MVALVKTRRSMSAIANAVGSITIDGSLAELLRSLGAGAV